MKALKTLVFVESTWEDAGSVLRDPALNGLKHVRLDLDAPDVDTVDCEDVTIPSDPSVHSVHSDLPPSDMSASLAERKTKKAKKAKKVGLYWRKTPVAVPGSSGGGKRSQGSNEAKWEVMRQAYRWEYREISMGKRKQRRKRGEVKEAQHRCCLR